MAQPNSVLLTVIVEVLPSGLSNSWLSQLPLGHLVITNLTFNTLL